jgi:hypothetical protein
LPQSAAGGLNAQELLRAALRKAGRGAFSDTSFVAPLERLVTAYNTEANLSAFGRRAARFDIGRSLDNILCLDAAEEADASIRGRPIARPLFITGLPRSATTFLHALLAEDPGNAVPRCWQLIYPYPKRTFGRDRRRRQVGLQLAIFRLLSPGVGDLHPLFADAPQECTDITAQVFESPRFDTTHHVPSYQAWYDAARHESAFAFHRRFLQHLDTQMPGRHWVLKSPDHVFDLDAIAAVYPDARFVFLHRDPVSVVGSCAKLTELLRRPFTRTLDRAVVGGNVAARLIACADRMATMAASGAILHLMYHDVIADPLGAAAAIYRHCGREMLPAARLRMKAFVGRRHRRSRRRYDLKEFGLNAGELRERFAAYMDAFAVPSET